MSYNFRSLPENFLMLELLKISFNKAILKTLLALMIAGLFGCASPTNGDRNPPDGNRITDIIISEISEPLICTIEATNSLNYTSTKQFSPRGILLTFSDTALDIPKRAYIPPGNDIISSIEVDEIVEDKTTTTRIFIALKQDALFDLSPDDAGLQISFSTVIAPSNDAKPPSEIKKEKPELKTTQKSLPAASWLQSVVATPLENNITVHVRADGAIKNYKTFALESPARIVFDMYELKSRHKREQTTAVESTWVKRIRYFGYPEKVRLVLDTHRAYLSRYSAYPTETGMVINVGQDPAITINPSLKDMNDDQGRRRITLTWDDVPGATSYNVYWSTSPGVNKRERNKISAEKNSAAIKGLQSGSTYYFVVTTVKDLEESEESEELSFTVGP